MRALAFYLASVVAVNLLFTFVPMVELPWGDRWSVGSLLVGATFILRDHAQEAVGAGVWKASVVGALISALFNPGLALWSGVAFLVSELLDQLVYTALFGRPFHVRVRASHAVGVVVDSLIFLAGISQLTLTMLVVMLASKSVALFFVGRRRAATGVAVQIQ